jgi:hypothetical protein
MRAFLERHFEIFDFAIVALVSATVFWWGHWPDRDGTILRIMNGSRAAVYAAIVGLFGTIFGFALTAMSIVLAFAESPRLVVLERPNRSRECA